MANQMKEGSAPRLRPKSREILVGAFILIVVFLIEYIDAVMLSKSGPSGPDVFPPSIAQWDASLLLSINPALLSPILNILFDLITQLGSLFAVVALCVVLYWAGYRREAVLIFTTVVIGSLIVGALKLVILRPRPYSTLPAVVPLAYESGSSFPSGHTERIFGLAAVFPAKKSMRVLFLYLLAVAVAFSRMYLGVHYPLDVAVGILIGLVVGKVTLRLQEKVLKAASRFAKVLKLPSEF